MAFFKHCLAGFLQVQLFTWHNNPIWEIQILILVQQGTHRYFGKVFDLTLLPSFSAKKKVQSYVTASVHFHSDTLSSSVLSPPYWNFIVNSSGKVLLFWFMLLCRSNHMFLGRGGARTAGNRLLLVGAVMGVLMPCPHAVCDPSRWWQWTAAAHSVPHPHGDGLGSNHPEDALSQTVHFLAFGLVPWASLGVVMGCSFMWMGKQWVSHGCPQASPKCPSGFTLWIAIFIGTIITNNLLACTRPPHSTGLSKWNKDDFH